MRKLRLVYLLVFSPVLMGADTDEVASKRDRLVVKILPGCEDNEYLSYRGGVLVCRTVQDTSWKLPDCSKTDQLMTHTMVNGVSTFSCVDKGTESLDPADITLINQTYARLESLKPQVASLPSAPTRRSARYCGQYTAAPNPNGAITSSNGVTGIAGAANLCATVAACGTGARMCTVYDLHNSAAAGALPASISPSWVQLSAWQHNNPAQVPTANGLADSCAGWTYPADDKLWYGTTVEWKNGPAGQKALHFASGPGVVPCSARFPIACCQ